MAGNIAQAIFQGIGEAGKGISEAWSHAAKGEEAKDIDWSSPNGGHTGAQGALKGFTNGLVDTTPKSDGTADKNSIKGVGAGTDGKKSFDFRALFSNIGNLANGASKAWSDEDLKCKYSKDANVVLDAYKNLDAIIFKYNNKAHSIEDSTGSIDDDLHTGIKAQDLEKSPVLASIVSTGPNGYKQVDTRELALANAAAIAELVKKVEELETRAILAKE